MAISARNFHKLESPERKALQDINRFLDLARTFRWKICVDLGCGIGYYTIPLAVEWQKSRTIFAVDRSTPMLEELDKRILAQELENIVIRQSVSDRIPIDDASIDLANMGNIYYKIKGRLNYLMEVYRILKPGGTILLIDWDPEEDTDIGPPLNELVPVEQVYQDMEFAGFVRPRKHFLFFGHYAISAKKPRPR